MSRTIFARRGIIAIALTTLLAGAPAFAEKPDGAGGGKPGGKPDHAQNQKLRSTRDTVEPRDRYRETRDDHGQRPLREPPSTRTNRNDRADRDDRRDRDYRSERDYRDDRNDRDDRNVRDGRRETVREHRYFEDRQRTVVRDYYTHEYRRGHCPPGLAKKHNGCVPPGIAKKWRVGERLPRSVIYYDLPPALVLELGAPPPRHRYVRIGADILMIAIGTGLVVDALEDLSGM